MAAAKGHLVADAHIGKALRFRRLGVPVPHGTTGETLDRLSALIESQREAHDRVFAVADNALHELPSLPQ